MKTQENGLFRTLNQWAEGSSPTEVTETKSEGLTPNDKK